MKLPEDVAAATNTGKIQQHIPGLQMRSTKWSRWLAVCLGLTVFLIAYSSTGLRTWTHKKALLPIHSTVTVPSHVNRNVGNRVGKPSEKVEVLTYKKIVIILAYMRTGSSLTGSVFQEHPGAFYLFEPIRSLKNRFGVTGTNGTVKLEYPNGTTRFYSQNDKDVVQLSEIKNWVACNLGEQSLLSLSDNFHKQYTKMMGSLQTCAVNKLKIRFSPRYRITRGLFRNDIWDKCLRKTVDKCRESPLVVIKFIRLPMSAIKQLMPAMPNLKVIHLNRDPRGVFNSRSKLKLPKEQVSFLQVAKHCQRWADDLMQFSTLSKAYPGRFLTVQYEKIAGTPMKMFSEMSRFVGIPFGEEMKRYIRSVTAATADDCNFCQHRKNSTATASKWRKQMTFTKAKTIYETCKVGNSIMGYRNFDSAEDVRNLSLPYYT